MRAFLNTNQMVGNLMIDSLQHSLASAYGGTFCAAWAFPANSFSWLLCIVLPMWTIQRLLDEILGALAEISETVRCFPGSLEREPASIGCRGPIWKDHVSLEPLGPIDFLSLMSNSSVVFTDSGGIQEETKLRSAYHHA